jgi:hypothetical protein
MRNNRPLGQSFMPVTPNNSPTGASWGGKEYRGRQLDIKSGDPSKDQPVRVKGNPRAKVFNMELEEDVKLYEKVMQGVVNSRLFIAVKELLPAGPQFRVYLEWYEDFYTDPESAKNVK